MKNTQVLLILFSLCFLWGAGAETDQLEEVNTSIYETCMNLCTVGQNGFEDPILFHQCNNVCINEVKVKELTKSLSLTSLCEEQREVLRSVLSEEQIVVLRSIGAVDRKRPKLRERSEKYELLFFLRLCGIYIYSRLFLLAKI